MHRGQGDSSAARTLVAVIAVLVLLGAPLVGSSVALERPAAVPGPSSIGSTGASGVGVAGDPLAADGVPSRSDIDADQVFMRVELEPDGDARWAIEYRVRLASENETAAYESLQRDVRQNASSYVDPFAADMRRTAAEAENLTGRQMSVENVTVDATEQRFGRSYGVVTYRFEWTQFAAVEGEQLTAGDALSGLFLDSSMSLRVDWPESHGSTVVAPEPDDRGSNHVVWVGERSFGSGEPRVTIEPTPSWAGWLPVDGTLLFGTAVLVALVVLVGGLVWRGDLPIGIPGGGSGRPSAGASGSADAPASPAATVGTAEGETAGSVPDDVDSAAGATSDPDGSAGAGRDGGDVTADADISAGATDGETPSGDGTAAEPAAGSTAAGSAVDSPADSSADSATDSAADPTADSTADPAADSSADPAADSTADSAAGDAESSSGEPSSEEPPVELLSNEERVLKLLRENGGRIKQQQVVQQLDWTAAKTSQVVNGMYDDGDVEKFRLGRENVLKLPEGNDDER